MKKQIIYFLTIILLSSCATTYEFNKINIDKFELTSDDYKNLQYFVDEKIIWEHVEENSEESSTTVQGKALSKSSARKAINQLILKPRTLGVYYNHGSNWIDIDFGDNLIIRFDIKEYSCYKNIGSSYRIKHNGIDYKYSVDRSGPAELMFKGIVLNKSSYKTKSTKVKGKRIN